MKMKLRVGTLRRPSLSRWLVGQGGTTKVVVRMRVRGRIRGRLRVRRVAIGGRIHVGGQRDISRGVRIGLTRAKILVKGLRGVGGRQGIRGVSKGALIGPTVTVMGRRGDVASRLGMTRLVSSRRVGGGMMDKC